MLLNEGALERSTTAQVGRGLYVLKYISGVTEGSSPIAVVCPGAGHESSIEVVSAPSVTRGLLSGPGECLVVRAERPGELFIRLIRQNVHASFEASFRLELLFAGDNPSQSALASVETSNSPADDAGNGLRLCAHVARRGDVVVSAAQWVAGPGAPAAIEGVEIRGDLPGGVNVEIQALVSTNPPRWLDWAPSGSYAGTRGRSIPLAGLRIRLVGPAASRFVLHADALFLGSAIVSRKGREIDLVGAGGADPLVGLRLALSPMELPRLEVQRTPPVLAAENTTQNQRHEPRVRVFRAQARV